MGFEYSLKFAGSNRDSIEEVLAKCPGSMKTSFEGQTRFEFREALNHGEMPNATTFAEAGGVYFCDHGGGIVFLGSVVARLVEQFGPLTVAERE
jgi:hypothetical protein